MRKETSSGDAGGNILRRCHKENIKGNSHVGNLRETVRVLRERTLRGDIAGGGVCAVRGH